MIWSTIVSSANLAFWEALTLSGSPPIVIYWKVSKKMYFKACGCSLTSVGSELIDINGHDVVLVGVLKRKKKFLN